MEQLAKLSHRINTLNEYIGRGTAWLAVSMVLVQFIVVILRYVFAIGFIPLQETIWYMHGILFMLGAGYTLFHDGHVRVDILYREAPIKTKAKIDIFGVIFFLIPVCILLWWVSWSYVVNSWIVLEGSVETSGLPTIFLLKTVILVFVILLGLQAISTAIRSILILAGLEDRAKELTHESF